MPRDWGSYKIVFPPAPQRSSGSVSQPDPSFDCQASVCKKKVLRLGLPAEALLSRCQLGNSHKSCYPSKAMLSHVWFDWLDPCILVARCARYDVHWLPGDGPWFIMLVGSARFQVLHPLIPQDCECTSHPTGLAFRILDCALGPKRPPLKSLGLAQPSER